MSNTNHPPLRGWAWQSVESRSKVHGVDTSAEKPKDPYNSAITALLRGAKGVERATFPALEAATGIKLRQLKALFNDEVPMHLGEFLAICNALKLDPADVVSQAVSRSALPS